eukprot:CAMPEP_0114584298 /NCGR_PEP_ID=MMETSP0125-20121206/8013_1 /TAXON_ID=485358 ORGANISM="Aristerostoma sp., Strain ATCC 50986" /NCGR_SAMPLE_ID=MMETSP0125 /ASSEMBLY_ACC=CAM_ASM_000245 /LENGTH=89 /DNA_ID=CAMNT_0001778579 /DNA_START=696 /DNA_END=961 /DNA_ORIENTATION=-
MKKSSIFWMIFVKRQIPLKPPAKIVDQLMPPKPTIPKATSPPVEEEEVDDEEEEEEEVIPAFIPKEKVEEVELKWYEQPYEGQFPVSGW